MWPRTVEVMLACWLAISPFIFGHQDSQWSWWWTDWGAAILIAVFALISFVHQARRAHVLELLVALWLIGFGWATSPAGLGAPAQQNWICIGLLVGMMAIIPTDCVRPPERWRDWNRQHEPSAAQ
jgi:hypothetical protein